MDPETYVASLYRSVLGREADAGGLAHWANVVRETGDYTIVLANFLASDEYLRKRGDLTRQDKAIVERAKAAFGSRTYTIVDVGAQLLDPELHNFEGHIYNPILAEAVNYHVIGFDPLKDRLEYRAKTEADKNVSLLPYAIGDGGRHVLNVNNYDATSSLFELNDDLYRNFFGWNKLETVRRETVETKRLDDLLSVEKIDFLKVDVQGADLMVLQSGERILKSTHCIHCEVEFSPIYKDQPLYQDIAAYLRKRGFYLVDILIKSRNAYVNTDGVEPQDRLIWADALFFCESNEADVLTSQALTAAVIYGKTGLAAHLIGNINTGKICL